MPPYAAIPPPDTGIRLRRTAPAAACAASSPSILACRVNAAVAGTTGDFSLDRRVAAGFFAYSGRQPLVRGIRGAIQVERNEEKLIFEATRRLLSEMIQRNQIEPDAVASAFLTATTDLDCAFPAYAVRELAGWDWVPLLCAQELEVPNAMPRVIRVLLHVNTTLAQSEIHHVYLGAAAKLRPDLAARG
jgi:chorismate mutase